MKKLLSLTLVLVLCLALAACGGKEEPALKTVDIRVAISNGGVLEAAYKPLSVADPDGDGAVSIDDALIAAHDAWFAGGAEKGYASQDTEYGKSITRFWGVENGGSYGYYLNDGFVLPDDPIHAGDDFCAYSYADLSSWSDEYSYFTAHSAEAAAGEEVTLQLMKLVYDENWTLQALPCEGAFVCVNGEPVNDLITDAEGNITLKFDAAGEYTVSSDSYVDILVPGVCLVTVK